METRQTPPPYGVKLPKKPFWKRFWWIWLVVGLIVFTAIIQLTTGPDTEYGIKNTIEKLQADSVALEEDYTPLKKDFSDCRDIDTYIDKLRELGHPLPYNHEEKDSIRIYSHPRMASLAKHNTLKCDSILKEVLPMWRRAFAFVFFTNLRDINESTIVRLMKSEPDDTGLEVYSIRYINEKEIREDAIKYNDIMSNLGFKKVRYAATPESPYIEYTVNE